MRAFLCTLALSSAAIGTSVRAQMPRNLLSAEQKQKIIEYAKNMSIEDGVGQLLMVGIPADVKNYEASPSLDWVINELHIGNFIINDYHTYKGGSRDINKEECRATIGLLNAMQGKAAKVLYKTINKQEVQGLPLFIASDFEGTTLIEQSPIKHGLFLPPSSLALSTCYDSSLIRQVGKTVGSQLLSAGIHAILGPVLDIASKFNITMQNRVFGSTPEIVYKRASYFITGLQEAGIIVVGKHYPSHNIISNEHIEGNATAKGTPEQVRMYYNASMNDFRKEPLRYPGFNTLLDGVLTSHLVLGFIQHQDDDVPVTVSYTAVGDLLRESGVRAINQRDTITGFGFTEQVLITDDISNMGAIRTYMNLRKKSYEDIAIEAFDAGHDILLFAHLQVPNVPQRSQFSLDDLSRVCKALTDHINRSSSARKHFREALVRILTLKAKINNKISGNSDVNFPTSIKPWINTPIAHPTKMPPNSQFNQPQDLYQAVYDKAVICLNKKAEYNFSKLPHDATILFAIDSRMQKKFEHAFQGTYPNATFFGIPITGAKQEQLVNTLKENLAHVQWMVFTMITKEHKDILISLMKDESTHDKMIVFLHNNPSMLDAGSEAAGTEIPKQRITLLGNFDFNAQAFDSDIKVLRGEIAARPISNTYMLLVFIAGIHEPQEHTEPWKAAEGFAPVPFYNTDRELFLSLEREKLSDSIKVLNHKITVIGGIRLVGLCFLVALLFIPFSWAGKRLLWSYNNSKNQGVITKETRWYQAAFVVFWANRTTTWKPNIVILVSLLVLLVLLYLINPKIILMLGKWLLHRMSEILHIPPELLS